MDCLEFQTLLQKSDVTACLGGCWALFDIFPHKMLYFEKSWVQKKCIMIVDILIGPMWIINNAWHITYHSRTQKRTSYLYFKARCGIFWSLFLWFMTNVTIIFIIFSYFWLIFLNHNFWWSKRLLKGMCWEYMYGHTKGYNEILGKRKAVMQKFFVVLQSDLQFSVRYLWRFHLCM